MATGRVTQAEINKAAWAACDTFRGVVDAEHLQGLRPHHAVPQIHLRRLAGPLRRLQEAVRRPPRAHRGDAQERALRAARRRQLLRPATQQRHEPGNGERIDKALHAIEEANIHKLRDVFQDISFNSNKLGDEAQKNDILRHLLEDFAKPELNLRPSRVGKLDIIGNAYEFLIKNFASDARQEGRRVLHAARGLQPDGAARRSAARATRSATRPAAPARC